MIDLITLYPNDLLVCEPFYVKHVYGISFKFIAVDSNMIIVHASSEEPFGSGYEHNPNKLFSIQADRTKYVRACLNRIAYTLKVFDNVDKTEITPRDMSGLKLLEAMRGHTWKRLNGVWEEQIPQQEATK